MIWETKRELRRRLYLAEMKARQWETTAILWKQQCEALKLKLAEQGRPQ